MQRYFICNPDEIENKLRTLTKTGDSDDGWTHYYQDNTEKWLLTSFNSAYHGGGIPVLKRNPEPTDEELIDIALTSLNTNDIIGASLELSEREKFSKVDFRGNLLAKLSRFDPSKLDDFEIERLKLIIKKSDLCDSTNRREIVGKDLAEIQTDANYYRGISLNAIKILEDIGTKAGG